MMKKFQRVFRAVRLASGLILILAAASRAADTPTTPPTTAPAPKPEQTFENKKAGIRFKYPADWKPDKAQTALFDVAAPAEDTKGYATLTLDVPYIPPHIP